MVDVGQIFKVGRTRECPDMSTPFGSANGGEVEGGCHGGAKIVFGEIVEATLQGCDYLELLSIFNISFV